MPISATPSGRTRGRSTSSLPQLTLFSIETSGGSFAVAAQPRAGAEVRFPRGPLVRPARDRDPGPDLRARSLRRAPLPGAAGEPAFIIAVQCGQAAATCFCTSMRTGPQGVRGFDLALTELPEAFVVEVATERGQAIMAEHPQPRRPAATTWARRRGVVRGAEEPDQPQARDRRPARAALRRTSSMRVGTTSPPAASRAPIAPWSARPASATRSRMYPTWKASGATGSGSGTRASTPTFGHTAGGNTRPEIRSRYRQWLTHKLASWIDQYRRLGLRGLRPVHHLVPGGDRPDRGSRRNPRGSTPHDDRRCRPVPTTRSARFPARSSARSRPKRPDVARPGSDLQFGSSSVSGRRDYRVEPGQFNMLYLPGVGEVAISVSGGPEDGRGPGLAIRSAPSVGSPAPSRRCGRARCWGCAALTAAVGPCVQARRPRRRARRRGTGARPAAPRNQGLLLARRHDYGRVILLYGARQPVDLLFVAEYPAMAASGP